jgi:hypothetical protein
MHLLFWGSYCAGAQDVARQVLYHLSHASSFSYLGSYTYAWVGMDYKPLIHASCAAGMTGRLLLEVFTPWKPGIHHHAQLFMGWDRVSQTLPRLASNLLPFQSIPCE